MPPSKADLYNAKQIEDGHLDLGHLTELVRQFQRDHELLVDGYCGPATLAKLEELMVVEGVPEGGWQPWDGPLKHAPSNRNEYYMILGDPGSGSLNKRWYADNIVELHQNHGNELPFIPSHLYIHCHRAVEPYVREALRRASLSCPDYVIERFGSFNFRHMQHKNSLPLSTHAFGAAFDINPTQNRAVRFKAGDKPEPWSDRWWRIWPDGIPEGVVLAFESCHFEWGGRWETFVDCMHVEFKGPPAPRLVANPLPGMPFVTPIHHE